MEKFPQKLLIFVYASVVRFINIPYTWIQTFPHYLLYFRRKKLEKCHWFNINGVFSYVISFIKNFKINTEVWTQLSSVVYSYMQHNVKYWYLFNLWLFKVFDFFTKWSLLRNIYFRTTWTGPYTRKVSWLYLFCENLSFKKF